MTKNTFTRFFAALALLTFLAVPMGMWGQQIRDTKTDIMFAKSFGGYTTNSFSAAGTDRSAVANSTNATGVTYAMQVFNGSTGAVRGNQNVAASNYSCRNTTTYDGYYISSVSLTITSSGGGTLDGSATGRSIVYFGSTAYANPNTTAPSGTPTVASPNESGKTTLTWTNTDESVSYFILYNLKTAGTVLSESSSSPLTVVWTQKTGPSIPSTTLSIDDTHLTNTDVYTSTEAGWLSAIVNAGTETLSNPSISWASNNEDVATIDEDGVVTLVAAGTVTITASYAGEPNVYGPSSNEYTFVVEDSTPFAGGVVTFVAGTDTGTSTGQNEDQMTKSGVTVSSTSAAFATAEYRLYSGSTTTISTTTGTITEIVFTGNSTSYPVSKLSVNDGNGSYTTTTNNVGTWTGNAASVSFSASGQARASKIEVTVAAPSVVPSVTVTPNTISAPFAGAEGTLALTSENIEEFISFDYYFCDADGNELEDTDPDYPGDWIYAEINEESDAYTLSYIIDANDGAARTAYMKVYTYDDNLEEVFAIVTVNQAQYVVDYAELPFEWEGGASADFLALNGVTAQGLGSDYASGSAPYLIKFDNTGDYIQVKCDQQPGKVTIGVKMIGGASTSTITIQGSADGETFTDVEELTISGAQNDELTLETSNAFAANVRYVRMLFTKGSNVGVGPITIALPSNEPSITLSSYTIDAPADGIEDATLNINYSNLTITEFDDFGIQFYDEDENELNSENEPDWLMVLTASDIVDGETVYLVSYMVDPNSGDARTAYFKVFALGDEDYVYSNMVTVTQAAYVAPVTGYKYLKVTSTADLTSGQYLIVYEDGGLAFDGSLDDLDVASNTIEVTINDSEIVVDNITTAAEFTIDMTAGTIMSASGYYIGRTGDSNGMNASTTEAYENSISIDGEGNAVVVASGGAYLRYNNDSNAKRFRYYKSSSYTSQKAIQLYKKVGDEPATDTYTLEITGYANETGAVDYYLIASPVTVDPEDVEGMTDGAFDLYFFDESQDHEWINWKQQGDNYHFDLVPGKGYLYAHSTDVTLTLSGTPYNGEPIVLQKTEGASWEGWNLVGNPYGQNAYIDRDFYVMKADGSEIIESETDEIAPMQGIFVIAANDDEELTFSTEAPTNTEGKLVMNITDNRRNVIDRAVVRFGEGEQLPKFMLNPSNTKIYIPQYESDYAVVRSDNDAEMPVNFKAATDGTYTISVNAENVDMDYMHLIDNLNGNDIDLLVTPSYTFEANATDAASRFTLVYGILTGVNEQNENNFAYYNGSNWTITSNGDATLQVVDLKGRVLSSEQVNGSTNVNINQAAGVYMLRLVNGDNVKTQKVVVR